MKYFIDTEFIEGKQRIRKTWLEALTATKKLTEPTIDLISIGIVAEDGREYYAISKDFNLREAWNRDWIRENVLKPIELELFKTHSKTNVGHKNIEGKGDYKAFKWMLENYGKSNKQIVKEIEEFCKPIVIKEEPYDLQVNKAVFNMVKKTVDTGVDFYGYYSSYDWVAFCWLFNKMIELPKGYNWVCNDLKQWQDRLEEAMKVDWNKKFKELPNYPKKSNEHNALADARWNFELYKFLKQL